MGESAHDARAGSVAADATGVARPERGRALVVLAWMLGLGAIAASRFRGEWGAYQQFHRWLAERGVPEAVRNFDSLVLLVGAAALGACAAAAWRGGRPCGWLGLRRGHSGWVRVVWISLAPMVAGGLVLWMMRRGADASAGASVSRFVGGVIRAPIGEELLFRGLLVGVCAAAIGWSGRWFWINACAAAMVFALSHVTWSVEGVARGWATLAVTFAGGVWYAWLLARWQTLWVPMILHAGMNLGWMLAAADGGAGGGGVIENVLRAGTITIATWWTVRAGGRGRE